MIDREVERQNERQNEREIETDKHREVKSRVRGESDDRREITFNESGE